jgi:chromosome segregation ATPase
MTTPSNEEVERLRRELAETQDALHDAAVQVEHFGERLADLRADYDALKDTAQRVRLQVINTVDPAASGVEVKQAVLDLLAARFLPSREGKG